MYFALVAKSGSKLDLIDDDKDKEEKEKTVKPQNSLFKSRSQDLEKTSIWVYTSENHGTSIEVPLTPDTTVSDVISCVSDPVRGPGDLVAVAEDTEYVLQPDDNAWDFLFDVWHRTGNGLSFTLRYKDHPAGWPPPGLQARRQQLMRGGPPAKEIQTSHSRQLPGGAGDLTLAELQEMSSRQQQQMEAQQQVLVAKEQRLKYLKQQEARHAQLASESEQLKRIRERVENQELKLKKLRALRGQAEQYRINNGHLTSELDAVKAVFNEKEKELAMAVARVDQLTRQLQDLRNQGSGINGSNQPAASAELEKLKKELLIRNKLNEQQSNTIAAKEKLLAQRRDEVSRMDSRIHELQQRLKKRRSQEQQASQNQVKKAAPSVKPSQGPTGSNVATVEPYIQYAPGNVVKDDLYKKTGNFTKQDPKYQTLPSNVKFIPPPRLGDEGRIGGKKMEMNNNSEFIEEYELPTVLPVDNRKPQIPPPLQSSTNNSNTTGTTNRPAVSNSHPVPTSNYPTSINQKPFAATGPVKPILSHPGQQSKVTSNVRPGGQNKISDLSSGGALPGSQASERPGRHQDSTVVPQIPQQSHSGHPPAGGSSLHPVINILEEERQAGSGQSSPASSEGSDSSGGIQIIKPDSEVNTSSLGPVSAMIERLNKTNGQPAKPVPAPLTSQQNQTVKTNANQNAPQQNFATAQPSSQPSQSSQQQQNILNSIAHPHSPHLNQKPAPTYRYASKSQIANTYMGRLGSAAMEKYQQNLNTLYRNMDFQGTLGAKAEQQGGSGDQSRVADPSAGGDGHPQFGVVASPGYPDIASDKGSYKLNTPKQIRRRHSDSENEEMNKALQERQELEQQQQQQDQQRPQIEAPNTAPTSDKTNTLATTKQEEAVSSDKNKQNASKTSKPAPEKGGGDNSSKAATVNTQKSNNKGDKTDVTDGGKSAEMGKAEKVLRRTKSNLKQEGARKSNNRVSFDPLALLLDASLEGELDLVKKVSVQVDDVSTANDEGITALHNAICAGHYEIVKFLVEFGCDVNSPDSDGWTPLHCAASCNNLPMVRFLVEHGACVFATTISDHETAADKCEEDEDGYESCSDYLYSIQEKLGITNNGEVYAVFDYQATKVDELSFVIGDKLTVLRKGDEKEKEWWWSQLNAKEGYIPRNLLGLHPRVIQRPKEVSEC